MRWSALFDDLEAQLEALERAEREAEIAEHTRAERGAVGLLDRLAADLGGPLRLELAGAEAVEGELAELGLDWVVLRPAAAHGPSGDLTLVPVAAVRAVQGLSGRADPAAPRPPRRLGLRHALRAISRDRATVRLTDISGARRAGRIERVGRDHLDLYAVPDDLAYRDRTGGPWGPAVTVPYAALAAVVSPGAARP
jgi:hypothetical protein